MTRIHQHLTTGLFAAAFAVIGLAMAAPAQATPIFEDFNYGDPNAFDGGGVQNLTGENGGQGWTEPWQDAKPSDDTKFPAFSGNQNLTFNDPNGFYVNTGLTAGENGEGGGAMVPENGQGNPPNNLGTRSFTSQTGAVWASVLMQSGGDDFNRFTRLYINPTFDGSGDFQDENYIGLQGKGNENNPEPHAARANVAGSNNDFGSAVKGEVHLLIAKLDTDVNGSGDQLSLWLNPTITAQTEAGLGAADFVSGDGSDIWGSQIDAIGAHIRQQRGGGSIDAIRLSAAEGDFAVQEVLTGEVVPEPASLALLGLGGLCLLGGRRRQV